MLKAILNSLVEHPILASFFISDLGILLFHRPPFLFSVLMFSALLAMTMYLGQKLSLFNV